MNRLTERERISLLIMRGYGDKMRSYSETVNLFNATYRNGNNAIVKSTVAKTVKKFEQTGSVKDLPKAGRPVILTGEENSLSVLQSFIENPKTSIRKVALEHEVSRGTVYNILMKNKFHPFKMHLVHQLNEDDFDRRVEYCETMMQKIDADPDFLNNIVFSDEATFQLNGNVNRHNFRYWSDTNPHWMREDKSQYPQKLNVWAGILKDQIIGPFFIEGDLNAEKYEELLRNHIVPAIREIAGDNFEQIWFQQDGAPPHYARRVREYLNTIFPNRWIGRRGEIEISPRSPDLAPLDYFFWGYLKNRVYHEKPTDINDLRQKIINEVAMIPRETIQKAVSHFYHRIAFCQEQNGQQFEHLLD